MSLNPGTFKPWMVHKYLKANSAGFIRTAAKDIMGAQTLTLMNANIPIRASQFTCVREDSEWKARIKNSELVKNVLTLLRDNGMGGMLPGGVPCPACAHIVSECLLQDISLYRTMSGVIGLRLDYGHCTIPQNSKKQAFIMIGLKRVPDTIDRKTLPDVMGFFNQICEAPAVVLPLGVPAPDPAIDLNKARAPKGRCFLESVDMEDMQPLDPQLEKPCFEESVAYSAFDENNQFPTLPVTDTDYKWLLSKLPAQPDTNDPCTPTAQKMYGYVTMDRVCVKLQGIDCINQCGKWCNATKVQNVTTSGIGWLPPPICIDCEWSESLYAFFATFIVVVLTYYSYLSTTMAAVATWFYVPLPGNPEQDFNDLSDGNLPRHEAVNSKLSFSAMLALLFTTGIYSIFAYLLVNFLDWAVCTAFQWEQCIRIFGYQYHFSTSFYHHVNGTAHQAHMLAVGHDHRGRWIWPFPSSEINIDVCEYRLVGMTVVTWLSAWFLFMWWRSEHKVAIMKTVVTQTLIAEEEFAGARMGAAATGTAGMFTRTMAFLGGGRVP
jgi:hypothetical protein